MRGRKPRPTHLKLVTGNAGRRPLNRREPRAVPALPEPPAHLSTAALEEWKRLAPELARLGVLTSLDRAALAGYCQAYADWIEAEAKLRQHGKLMRGHRGRLVKSPYVRLRDSALVLMLKFSAEFGLTPSSRSRVVAAPPEPDDPADKYFR